MVYKKYWIGIWTLNTLYLLLHSTHTIQRHFCVSPLHMVSKRLKVFLFREKNHVYPLFFPFLFLLHILYTSPLSCCFRIDGWRGGKRDLERGGENSKEQPMVFILCTFPFLLSFLKHTCYILFLTCIICISNILKDNNMLK